MPNVVRAGDMNVAAGIAQVGASTVTCEGKPVMLPGMPVTPHVPCRTPAQNKPPIHCTAKTMGGSSTVTCEGKPVIHSGDLDTCGHKRQTFAATVTVGP